MGALAGWVAVRARQRYGRLLARVALLARVLNLLVLRMEIVLIIRRHGP